MREKSIVIICITFIICVAMICGTIVLTNNNNAKNFSINDTIINTTFNNTTNDNTNTNIEKEVGSSQSFQSKKSSSSSSISSTPTGNNVPTKDSNGNRVFRDGEWVGTSEGGAHVYRDSNTGQLFDSMGNLPNNYEYDPR